MIKQTRIIRNTDSSRYFWTSAHAVAALGEITQKIARAVTRPVTRPVTTALLVIALTGCVTTPPDPPSANNLPPVATQPLPPAVVKRPPKIGLALGGGAARGFAHVGVIQVLEAAGFRPSLVVGTSAGSLVAAIYASGKTGAAIMGKTINSFELPGADLVVRPAFIGLSSADFATRRRAIEAGRQAMLQQLPQLRDKMAQWVPSR